MLKKQVSLRPRTIPAEASIQPPWQMAPITAPASSARRTNSTIAGVRRM